MKDLFIQHQKELKDILRYAILRTEAMSNYGLYDGKLGMAILLYEYSRYANDELYAKCADVVLDSIIEMPDTLPLSFAEGLSGIGWGIVYLLKKKYIEGDINDILINIDHEIMQHPVSEAKDIQSVLTYISYRQSYSFSNDIKDAFFDLYSDKIKCLNENSIHIKREPEVLNCIIEKIKL